MCTGTCLCCVGACKHLASFVHNCKTAMCGKIHTECEVEAGSGILLMVCAHEFLFQVFALSADLEHLCCCLLRLLIWLHF